MFYVSASQIKTANASIAKRAWETLLWLYQDFQSDAFILWHAYEAYLCEWIDDLDIFCKWKEVYDYDSLKKDYEALLHNWLWIKLPSWELQKKINWQLLGYNFIGYADLYTDNCIYDIKTNRYLTEQNKWYPNSRSWMTSYQEYELQLWCYMKVSWVVNSSIIEVSKHRYKDWRNANKRFDFSMSQEFDVRMTNKFLPLIEKMKSLHDKYSHLWKDI